MRALSGCVTVEDVYAACRARADISRDRGGEPVGSGHGSDRVWKRRARSALQALRASGAARRTGKATWLLSGPPARPAVWLLIGPGARLADVEMQVADACSLLAGLDEPADLVLCDPPYGLGRGQGAPPHHYRRDHRAVLGGYRDVAPDAYRAFTAEWVAQAARALRPGGQLAAVTGPQRAAHVQVAAEDAGLQWVSSIAARREFAVYCRRRPSPAHWTVTVMSSGPLRDPARVFNPPAWQLARSGRPYPLDWWERNGRSDRPGALRYDNALPLALCRRLVSAFSDPGELVCDPFLGSGTVMIACVQERRRFAGADVNPEAVRFAAARLVGEHSGLLAA